MGYFYTNVINRNRHNYGVQKFLHRTSRWQYYSLKGHTSLNHGMNIISNETRKNEDESCTGKTVLVWGAQREDELHEQMKEKRHSEWVRRYEGVMKNVKACNVSERVRRNWWEIKISKSLHVLEWCKCAAQWNDSGGVIKKSIHKTLVHGW